jgi:uncharacterized RDD family membrane protein YckC
MRYISVGRRFVALLIDAIVLGIAATPFAETTRGPGYLRIQLVGGRSVWPILVWLAYFVVLEATLGATLGKLAMGIRVVKPDGSKLDWGSAFIRNLARLVDAFPYVIPYLVGSVAVWSDAATRQRLGDRWAHSVVVDRTSVPAVGRRADPSPDAASAPGPAERLTGRRRYQRSSTAARASRPVHAPSAIRYVVAPSSSCLIEKHVPVCARTEAAHTSDDAYTLIRPGPVEPSSGPRNDSSSSAPRESPSASAPANDPADAAIASARVSASFRSCWVREMSFASGRCAKISTSRKIEPRAIVITIIQKPRLDGRRAGPSNSSS